jgi:hypothetical protein
MAHGPGNTLADLLQAVDAAINELIALALAVFFLISVEARFKRGDRAISRTYSFQYPERFRS